MATVERSHGPATQVAVRNLASLKPEHQEILRTLLADRGMASATLETLAEHLLEEEDPRLMRALARVKAGHASVTAASNTGHASVTAASNTGRGTGATVGSLRPERATSSTGRGTVGSLRRS
jgi:hypothetical protein